MTTFAKQLKKYRKDNHLSQVMLAKKLYVTRQAVSKWEAGKSSPDVKTLINLSNIFNVSLDRLILNKSSSSVSKINNNEFIYNPNKNKYVLNLKKMNLYEFLVHYWWIVIILLFSFGIMISMCLGD